MQRVLTIAVVLALMAVQASAATGTFEAGHRAYQQGEFGKAREIWQPLAEQGVPAAQLAYGLLFYHGRGVGRDLQQAVAWIRLAAEQDLVAAQVVLAQMYFTGDAVTRDRVAALRWFRNAAYRGNAFAQNALGIMHRDGLGTPTNFVRAYIWFDLAARQAQPGAAQNRDDLKDKISPQYIEQAERAIAELLRSYRSRNADRSDRRIP